MTLQQIRLVLEAASCNSISIAAQHLGVAQSNASQSVKKLEEELGFSIFTRAINGITPTEEGYRFLDHAEVMMRETKAIRSISTSDRMTKLRIGVSNYTPPIEAFFAFCNEMRNASSAQLMCINISAEDGALKLKERSLDMVVSLAPPSSLSTLEQLCRGYRLTLTPIVEVPLVIRVRKDHPIFSQNVLDGTIKSYMAFSAYPYVEYLDWQHISPGDYDVSEVPLGCSYQIFVDERDSKLKATAATDAYSIGCPILKERLDEYGLVEIPITEESLTLITIIRRGDENLHDIVRYNELLHEKLMIILGDRLTAKEEATEEIE